MRCLPLIAASLAPCLWTGCGSGTEAAPNAAEARPEAAGGALPIVPIRADTCKALPFERTLPLAEASGAVFVPAHVGQPAHLLVVGDSGNRGSFNRIDPTTGEVLATGLMPLDPRASDDLEGLTYLAGTIYGLTSSGHVRHFRTEGTGYRLTQGAYPITTDSGLVCADAMLGNCGKNYEGLCLNPAATDSDSCAGFAVSKSDGALFCVRLRREGGATSPPRLVIEPSVTLKIARPETLSGCDFSAKGDLLWVGANYFGQNAVYRVRHWQSPKKRKIEKIRGIGSGFAEAIAADPAGALYRFSDTGGSPSLADKYRCE